MNEVLEIIFGIAILALFVWLMMPSPGSKNGRADADKVIDPSDSTQIGVLIGMTGGTIADAAVARYALQRFEEIHGRKATVRDMGIVAGLMSSMK